MLPKIRFRLVYNYKNYSDLASLNSALSVSYIEHIQYRGTDITKTLPFGLYMIGDMSNNQGSICFIYVSNFASVFLMTPQANVWTGGTYNITFPSNNQVTFYANNGADFLVFRC